MANFYVYLLSSLPMLQFGSRPPFSFNKFIDICAPQMPEDEAAIVSELPKVSSSTSIGKQSPIILKRWYGFEIALRNELVRIRAARKRVDPASYLRQENFSDPALEHLSLAAYRNPSLLEGEKLLDEARWQFLSDLEQGHYFDFEALLVYALKLLILLRWETVRMADTQKLLEEVLPGYDN